MVRHAGYCVLHAVLLCCPLCKALTIRGMSQVQILVHVRPADHGGKAHFELLELETHTSILEVKQQVARYWTMQSSMADRKLSGCRLSCIDTAAGRAGRKDVRRI